ncbi:hypothetical protein N3K66_004131 [Trichothecium roseum]|uniref:Uncharacterized protein n=1 Tax=Trichothecium roseum TaxID=47278 RepID=A0ACC0V1V2_9HYPO|nr:hypothetical protein N3K66_004131 [Trichothecium roseum]
MADHASAHEQAGRHLKRKRVQPDDESQTNTSSNKGSPMSNCDVWTQRQQRLPGTPNISGSDRRSSDMTLDIASVRESHSSNSNRNRSVMPECHRVFKLAQIMYDNATEDQRSSARIKAYLQEGEDWQAGSDGGDPALITFQKHARAVMRANVPRLLTPQALPQHLTEPSRHGSSSRKRVRREGFAVVEECHNMGMEDPVVSADDFTSRA